MLRGADPLFVAVAAEVLAAVAACVLRSLPDWLAACNLHNSVLWGLATSLNLKDDSCKYAVVNLTAAAAVAAGVLLPTTGMSGVPRL